MSVVGFVAWVLALRGMQHAREHGGGLIRGEAFYQNYEFVGLLFGVLLSENCFLGIA